MSKNTKSKYGELIMDIASTPSFRIDEMRAKHKVSTRVFTVMRSMQIIKKQGKEHVWVGEQPTQATINLIAKQCRYTSRVEKVMAKELPTNQLSIKPIKRVERSTPVPVQQELIHDTSNSKMLIILAVGTIVGFLIATLIWK